MKDFLKRKILVVGQTPPPYGGQALMIKYMLDADYKEIEFFHIRMNFSREMNERGKFSFYKITHLISIIVNTYILRFKYKIDTLYYPPSNSPKVAIYRDFIFLLCTKFFFKKVCYHFHAAGISEVYPMLNAVERKVVKMALSNADLTISSSSYNPEDGAFFNGKKNIIIPLGIPDICTFEKTKKQKNINILFVGLLNSTKGEMILLDAIKLLKNVNMQVRLSLAGKFETDAYRNFFFQKVVDYGLQNYVEYIGVISGDAKRQAFTSADIFCFPSYFISESFGIVLLEAMQYQLPIIATKWRGIQSIVEDGSNGYLIDIKNSEQLAERIGFLIKNEDIRSQMGYNARKTYEAKYKLEYYLNALEKAFISI
ncbi:glycosyltransferase [Spirosoma litoris]